MTAEQEIAEAKRRRSREVTIRPVIELFLRKKSFTDEGTNSAGIVAIPSGSFNEMTPKRNILLLARFSKRSERDRAQKRSRNYLEDDAALAFMGMTLVAAGAGLMLQYRSASCLVTNSL